MRYRKLDANYDMVFGHGQADFWRDQPEAPAQACLTRLSLWLGEWFLNPADGTPYATKVLGKFTTSTRDPVLRARISGTPGVKSIVSYGSQVNHDTREFNVQATIDTIYGNVTIGFLKATTPAFSSVPATPFVTQK